MSWIRCRALCCASRLRVKHGFAIKLNIAGNRFDQLHQAARQGAFAGSGLAGQAMNPTALQFKVHALHRVHGRRKPLQPGPLVRDS